MSNSRANKNGLIFLNLILTTWLQIFNPSTMLGQHYEFSSGLYRIGYEDGADVHVSHDIYDHDPLGKYDLQTSVANRDIVAGAPGWIRWIEESHTEECDCCWENNNFVVIEHPNGEWTEYTHIKHNTASNAGRYLNEWVETGTVLGTEGSVGCSTGRHLHFEMSRPTDLAEPFDTIGGFLNGHGEMLIPVIAGVQPEHSFMADEDDLIAGPPDDNCPSTITYSASQGDDDMDVARADNYIQTSTSTEVIFSNGSTAQFRAGNYVVLKVGFHARAGTAFSVILRGCNQQN